MNSNQISMKANLGSITQLMGGTTQATSGLEYLTPESLLTYVETQLRSLDGDIRKRLEGQREVIARKKVLGDIENAVAKGGDNKAEIEAAIAKLPENDPLRAKLEDILDDALESAQIFFQKKTGNPWLDEAKQNMAQDASTMINEVCASKLSEQQSEALKTTVKNELADENAASEINMIEVQSLMSQRTTAVQLGTGIMQKINQSLEMIAKNI